MILGFMQKWPWGEPTNFKQKILLPYLTDEKKRGMHFAPKIHTIREGDRWKPWMSIQMAHGVRTKQYEQFNKGIQRLETCWSVQKITIINEDFNRSIIIDKKVMYRAGHPDSSLKWLIDFAKNDGFDGPGYFWMYFNEPLFEGQLIHWTDKTY